MGDFFVIEKNNLSNKKIWWGEKEIIWERPEVVCEMENEYKYLRWRFQDPLVCHIVPQWYVYVLLLCVLVPFSIPQRLFYVRATTMDISQWLKIFDGDFFVFNLLEASSFSLESWNPSLPSWPLRLPPCAYALPHVCAAFRPVWPSLPVFNHKFWVIVLVISLKKYCKKY